MRIASGLSTLASSIKGSTGAGDDLEASSKSPGAI